MILRIKGNPHFSTCATRHGNVIDHTHSWVMRYNPPISGYHTKPMGYIGTEPTLWCGLSYTYTATGDNIVYISIVTKAI